MQTKIAGRLRLPKTLFHEPLRQPSAERYELQHHRERAVLDAAPDGVLAVDQDGVILLANPAMETLSGYSVQELVGSPVDLFLPHHLRTRHALSLRAYFAAPHPRAMGQMDLTLLRRDGSTVPVDISLGHWEDEHGRYAIAYLRDLTERKRFEESLRYQATHDELTGLPNRWLFRLQLNQALAQARRNGHHVGVLFLDLDDFKTVNDSFGHMVGDELLVQVSRRLRGVLRANDSLARLGGDEFAVLISDMHEPHEAVGVAEKLLLAMDAVFRVREHEVQAGGSIGLAFYPDDAADAEGLLRYADMAMYQAKQSGRAAYACYSSQLDQRAHENMQLQVRLKEAIRQGHLRLMYQPQVNVEDGTSIVGVEALVRWHDDVLGEVSPARFVPIAETTGLIHPLSEWVLETACRQIAEWTQAGTPLPVAVNFSAQQFRQRNLPGVVAAVLQRTGAQARWLEIEITESVAMAQPAQAREQLDALVALGCSVALDDFGTGYSSLAYLKALPVAKLKIDREFVKDIPQDPSNIKIARSIIALAHSLGLTLVAEGVETDAQLAVLRQYGCETYQGWLFARALEARELSPRLRLGRAV